MKARVKATGEIVELAEYSTVYLEHYDKNYHLCELEFIQDIAEFSSIDWEQRRYEIAKDIIATSHIAQQIGQYSYIEEKEVKDAVRIADLLIAELKKSKEQL